MWPASQKELPTPGVDSCHESRLMKSNFHKKTIILRFIFMTLHKNTENCCLFCMFMEYESRLIQYFIELVFTSHESRLVKKVYRICFYESSLNMSVDSWKNTHKTFLELTPVLYIHYSFFQICIFNDTFYSVPSHKTI